jgi:hypothetical protein
VSERYNFMPVGARAHEVAHFVMHPAKAVGRLRPLTAPHRSESLFAASVVLLQMIISVAVGTMTHLFP